MSDFRIGTGPFFERGIDSITFQGGEAAQSLPDPRELAPAEQVQRPQLDRLLAQPRLEDVLELAVRPELADRTLLMPARFRQAMDAALGTLRQAAQARRPGDPEGAQVLERASRLLHEEIGLRELLQMYRSVLYQG